MEKRYKRNRVCLSGVQHGDSTWLRSILLCPEHIWWCKWHFECVTSDFTVLHDTHTDTLGCLMRRCVFGLSHWHHLTVTIPCTLSISYHYSSYEHNKSRNEPTPMPCIVRWAIAWMLSLRVSIHVYVQVAIVVSTRMLKLDQWSVIGGSYFDQLYEAFNGFWYAQLLSEL